MSVNLTRHNAPTHSEFRIYAPRFPKPQTEGYFLIVCNARPDGTDGELLGLKRVSWPSKQYHGKGRAGPSRGTQGPSKDQSNRSISVRSLVKFPGAALVESSSVTTTGMARVNVKLFSDSYIGMQWSLSNVEVDVDTGATQAVEAPTAPSKA
jgi:antiviral helicase SLH1